MNDRRILFGISGFIEDEFEVSNDWKEISLSFLQSKSHIASMKEITKSEIDYFVVSFPLYGLPLQLFLVSPKQLVLNPILIDLENNLYFFLAIIFISLILSGIIAKREKRFERNITTPIEGVPQCCNFI